MAASSVYYIYECAWRGPDLLLGDASLAQGLRRQRCMGQTYVLATHLIFGWHVGAKA